MELSTIKDRLNGFYRACGFETRDLPKFPKALEARKTGFSGTSELTILWAEEDVPEAPNFGAESRTISQLGELQKLYPRATYWFICHTTEGLSQEFRRFAKRLGFNLREQALFFDAEFRSDINSSAIDISKELRSQAASAARLRVPQPFERLSLDGSIIGKGADLAQELAADLTIRPVQAKIRIIIGPAGAGKSIAFNQLFAQLYDGFTKEKRRRREACRPIPIVPKHISRRRGNTFLGTLDNFLQSEIAVPVGANGINWMLDNGILQYLLDGLDEVLSADELFFEEFLQERLTVPNGKGQLTICVRDSLFNTCMPLAEFVEIAPAGQLEILRLQRWDYQTKQSFALKRFGDPATGEKFLVAIQKDSVARELSDIAFFCEILAQAHEAGKLASVQDACSLCQVALENIIEREYDKALLSEAQIGRSDLFDFLEAAACEQLASGFAGIPIEELRVDAETFSVKGMSPDEKQQLVARLIQLPVFEGSAEQTKVSFVHEILGFYLLAKSLANSLANRPEFFATSMDNPSVLARGILLRLLAELVVREGSLGNLWKVLESSFLPDAAFRGIIQTAVQTRPKTFPEAIRRDQFCNRNLEGVHFSEVDLENARFDNADLTNVEISDCNLRGASFSGAVLRSTHFNVSSACMGDVKFGNFSSVYSVKIRGQYYDDPIEAASALADLIQQPRPSAAPCPTAFQTRFLFSKFVKPNGQPWRDSLDMRAFLAGKKFPGSASNHDILDALSPRGYLTLNKSGARIIGVSRGTGSILPETINFVTHFKMSEGIKAALDEICPKSGCEHVPVAYVQV